MKAFFFVNQYLAGVHCGIQAGHCIDQMWLKYYDATVNEMVSPSTHSKTRALESLSTIVKFSRDHGTFVLLNGGDHAALSKLFTFMHDRSNYNPFQWFQEPGLNHTITCVGIILPERLYNADAQRCGQILAAGDVTKKDGTVIPAATMADPDNLYTDWEREFLARKSRCRLAQ